MTDQKFEAQVSGWVKQSKRRMDAVRKESVQRLVTIAQTPVAKGGNMPIDTGFLRSSLLATTTAIPRVGDDYQDSAVGKEGDAVSPTITVALAGWTPEQTLYLGWTAVYARAAHYGSESGVGVDERGGYTGRPARLWVTLAAQRWPQIVAEVARELRSRSS